MSHQTLHTRTLLTGSGAAGFEAMKAYEDHLRQEGKPQSVSLVCHPWTPSFTSSTMSQVFVALK